MGKMFVVVSIGSAVGELPAKVVAGTSAATFLMTSIFIWFKKPGNAPVVPERRRVWSKALLISFAAIFFSEWADIGQITTATLAARYQSPLTVWLGATLALVVKGILALTLGMGLRKALPREALRYGAFALCLLMGILAALRIEI